MKYSESNTQMTTLEDMIKDKLKTNEIYFKSTQRVEMSEYGIDFEKNALLYKTNLPALSDREVYLSIMYDDASTESNEEGLIRIPIKLIALMIITKKIMAMNNKNEKLNKEIAEYISYYNGGN